MNYSLTHSICVFGTFILSLADNDIADNFFPSSLNIKFSIALFGLCFFAYILWASFLFFLFFSSIEFVYLPLTLGPSFLFLFPLFLLGIFKSTLF